MNSVSYDYAQKSPSELNLKKSLLLRALQEVCVKHIAGPSF